MWCSFFFTRYSQHMQFDSFSFLSASHSLNTHTHTQFNECVCVRRLAIVFHLCYRSLLLYAEKNYQSKNVACSHCVLCHLDAIPFSQLHLSLELFWVFLFAFLGWWVFSFFSSQFCQFPLIFILFIWYSSSLCRL